MTGLLKKERKICMLQASAASIIFSLQILGVRLLWVLNLNLLLKLLPRLLVTTYNNLPFRIYCENVVNVIVLMLYMGKKR